ncbi:branched-chain amino acid transporter permease [Leucobacter komagatae]|uniref:Branched-chain amino acid transporter AzlD n=1 Tax=Leucobacter komagatae TaxID=55969 RepID=A0A0D0I1W1_9MICO|nr:AzlD domain-containing protein [Leucobacter komagatae]KIP53726.1 branched-chain amino acid transporter AzlD [Leucobacter komagatae]
MTWYLIAAIAIAGIITFLLRALPFAMLKPLRRSKFVRSLGEWMPAGILLILAVVVLRDEIVARGSDWWMALVATAVTVAVHLLGGRRVLLSIAVGTACYVLLVNLF